jgi:hypothetical protein
MKLPSLVLTIALAAVLTVPASREANAAYSGIQRCEASDGTAVYTDRPCSELGARPSAMSSELNLRLASEPVSLPTLDVISAGAVLAPADGGPAGRRSAASGCARTPTQLAMDLQGSIALHDINRLAESYHWVGMTHASAEPVLARLERMSRGTVIAAQFHDTGAGFGFADAANRPAPGAAAGTMLLSLAGDGGGQTLQMNVEHYAGCYFVRF